MTSPDERNAIRARRALLRQQTRLLGPRLAWLADPTLIPGDAVDPSVAPDDVHLAAFSLAGWMLIEIVQAADQVYQELDWRQALEGFKVTQGLQTSVSRAVMCPAARHAPGLFAIAEIVSAIPMVASRSGVRRERWREIASRSQAFGAMLAHDGTAVQVLIRNYLSRKDAHAGENGMRFLNPAQLRLDDKTGLTTVTPLGDLLAAARGTSVPHDDRYHSTCVALQAPAPHTVNSATTMFDAVWASFADAASRLVFPRFNHCHSPVPPETGPDTGYEETFARLAAQRREDLERTVSRPYPPSVERVMSNLLAAAQNRVAASCPEHSD